MMAMAAGLATMGFQPYATTFTCFAVARALDSVRVLIAQPRLDVKIIGGYACPPTRKARNTQPNFDHNARLRPLPFIIVVAPAHETQARPADAAGGPRAR